MLCIHALLMYSMNLNIYTTSPTLWWQEFLVPSFYMFKMPSPEGLLASRKWSQLNLESIAEWVTSCMIETTLYVINWVGKSKSLALGGGHLRWNDRAWFNWGVYVMVFDMQSGVKGFPRMSGNKHWACFLWTVGGKWGESIKWKK